MAFEFPGMKYFKAADAKSRVFLVFAAVVAIGLFIYVIVRYFGGSQAATGPSQVAAAPSNLQTVPGGQMSPEFYRAVMQANQQAAQQAQISGGSAVPSLIQMPGQQSTQGNCTVLCSDEAVNVSDDINNLVRAGKLSQEDANRLLDLVKSNASVEEYEAALAELVRQGKLTPEQARLLLDRYKRQHQAALVNQNASVLDADIKSGNLPLDVANQLLALQKSGISAADYAAELDRLVREGKISPAEAARLLAQFTQQCNQEAIKKGTYLLRQSQKIGEITPDVANSLTDLQTKAAPFDQYSGQLDRLVSGGKMTPVIANKLRDQYKTQKSKCAANNIGQMCSQEQTNSINQLNDMVKNGKLTGEDGSRLYGLQQKMVPPEAYQAALDDIGKKGKLIPDDAKKLFDQYQKASGICSLAKRLGELQANNASAGDYADELKRAVQAGIITPEMAAAMLQQYQGAGTVGPTIDTNIPGTEAFAQLQQRLQSQQPTGAPTEFTSAAGQAESDMLRQQQERIAALASAMSGQAQTLLTAWQPPVMVHKEGTPDEKSKTNCNGCTIVDGKIIGPDGKSVGPGGPTGAPIIKAGTILFAVLDTGVDSDYPDTPVMATIVEGKFKGAKVLGKMQLVSGKDKLSLTFNLMDRDDWAKGKSINAFAIDPDTARTVMASSVDHRYLQRYGSMFAASFLSGYSSAIMASGATTTQSIFGSSTSTPALSPASKFAVGLGKVGDSLTKAIEGYVNTPPTVKVNSGVGLGILFMSDVSE
jgi:polyhydroxyalkanoate synthesis regulator phasin